MPQKILIIQTAFPGDAILTLPLIQVLKKRDSKNHIGVVSIPATADVFNASPYVDEVFVLDKRGKHKSIASVIKFAKIFKNSGYTSIITPHRSLRTAMLVYFSGIKNSTGFSNSTLPIVFTNIIKYDKAAHEVERNLSLIDYHGDWRIIPELQVESGEGSRVTEIVNKYPGKKVAIAPGSVWETKKYPEEYFATIASAIQAKGYTVFLIGGKTDWDLCERIRGNSKKNIINISGEFSIPGTVELLRHVEFIISNDSAPSHMGTAAGTKVYTIYCSTVPSFGFYPYMEGSGSIGLDDVRCKPCGIHGYKKCPEGHFDCGRKLTPLLTLSKIFS